ncbi:MAG: D-glycero-beta-D-manno-heptose 1-phosphate adenylyltransferase [Gemmatimonadota bacterium]
MRSEPGPAAAGGAPIFDAVEARTRFAPPRSYRLVFTNGCFDLLHPGHVSLLCRARGLGDVLVVGLNADDSVRAIKGPGRPLVPATGRAALLASLRYVDAVVLFDAETPLALIEAIRPDVLVKGADYRAEEVVGADLVERWGGEVVMLPLQGGCSTSALIRKILEVGPLA